MINKKIILLFLILLIIIFFSGVIAIKYVKNREKNEADSEYIPQEEISEEQSRETIVTLYFIDKESNTMKPEARLINIKDLIKSPYNTIIDLLINGPKNERLKAIIPENTKLLGVTVENECLILDFSDEILKYEKNDEKNKSNLINTIVNTVTELNEINKVKILINGKNSNEFNDEYTRE